MTTTVTPALVIGTPDGVTLFTVRFTIGRIGRACDLGFADTYLSGEHAHCFPIAGNWWVQDLGTMNGTLLNGTRIHEATRIRKGDRLTVGRTTLTLVPCP